MKSIDIKKPKYILPLIALPFLLGIGWVAVDMFASAPVEESILVTTDDINVDIPDANLHKKDVKTKLGAVKDAYKKSTDFSSIQAIEKESAVNEFDEDFASLYTDEEMREIDSIQQVSRLVKEESNAIQERYNSREIYSYGEPDRNGTREEPKMSKMQEEMELFKMQMDYIDSIQNRRPSAEPPATKKKEAPEAPAIEVLKAKNPAETYFNTVGSSNEVSLITAILDESIKVTQGSRVRIRLLDDIMIQDMLVPKGTYLYGNVSGFKAQRVSISISSIMIDGKQKKVDLSVYDNDGQEGFYVPESAFRDLAQDIGGQIGSQTIQFGNQTEGIEQFAYGALQDMYRSTTQAISKNIKKNKAKLKYNTQIFLVNNKEKDK